jgi:hypothetical protein
LIVAAVLAGCGGGHSAGGKGGASGAGAAGAAGTAGAAGAGAAGAAGTAGAAGAAGTAGAAGSAAGSGGSTGGTTGAGGSVGTGGSAAGISGAGIGGGIAGVGGSAGTAGANGDAAADRPDETDAGDGGPSDADGGLICAPVSVPVSGFAPDILVLLDSSASMNNDVTDQNCAGGAGCGLNSKWALTTAALEQVVSSTQANVNWGLKFFPDSATCGVNQTVAVSVAPLNLAPIMNAIAGRTTTNGGLASTGNTPTRLAEAAAAAYLSSLADMNPKFILLATDGEPNCIPGGTNISADDSPGALQAVYAANGAGVPTFVVGIGALTQANAVLSQLAAAGGYPRSADPLYYPVSGTDDLIATLNQLAGIAHVCRFTFVTAPDGYSRDAIDVVVNGTTLPYDQTHTDGWDYFDANHTTFDVYGPTCTAIMNGTVLVRVVFRCPPSG